MAEGLIVIVVINYHSLLSKVNLNFVIIGGKYISKKYYY